MNRRSQDRTRKRLVIDVLIVAFPMLVGCAFEPPKPPRSVFQVREIQTRTFENRDARSVQKAVLDVLQDDNYVVKNAVVDLGLISATKERALKQQTAFGFGSLVGGSPGWAINMSPQEGTWPASEVFEATVNVSQHGKDSKVRVNVQRRVVNNRGATIESEIVEDPQFYQDFFSKVSKGLFIQKEKL
jgi:hypothetical protein